MKPQKKKSLVGVFFRTLLISTALISIILCVAFFGFRYFDTSDGEVAPNENIVEDDTHFFQNLIGVPNKTNFAILGTDETSSRTDFMLVGCYNDKEETVDLISVPRDTMVTMPKERVDTIAATGAYVPPDGVMKLCEVYHFAGEELGLEYSLLQLEEELGVTFDYYALVNLEAFNYVVTEMGGVVFDVPQRMYYNDPEQDLYIDLYPGVQTLNAEQAEGLVRYRKADLINPISPGYVDDEQRMKVQQDFIIAMAEQLLAKDINVGTFKTALTTFYQYIETNLSMTDALKYANAAKDMDISNIHTYTLPSTEERVNGKSYQVLDEAEKDRIINEVFYAEDLPAVVEQSSKDKTIQILNGGYTQGLASQKKEELEQDGFTVSEIGDYEGEKQEITRIIVKEEGQGEDLGSYFNDYIIEVDPTYPTDYDIVVILGISES